MRRIGETEAFKGTQNIILKGFDPVSSGGFTQIPNLLLNDPKLSFSAKVVYSKLLSYAWHNAMVFPGQERMAKEIGSKRSTVNKAIKDLERSEWLEITRRGQGKTNLYVLKHTVTRHRDRSGWGG
jgi:biotin operon repressor